jgi:transforming growth factor-beta-induced protein
MRCKSNAIAVAALLLLFVGTQQAGAESKKKDIVDTAVAAGSFKTLAAALEAADLVGALKGKGPFTVFAPTDKAFAALPKGTVASLLKPENKKQLAAVLTYHVVPGKVTSDKVVKLTGAKSLNGQQIDIKVNGSKVAVDKANVVTTDIVCSNGVIHVIDAVILPAADNIPATAEKAGSFKTLLAALKAAGLAEVLSGKGPFTVFAPTDEAFARLPEGTVEMLLKPENKAKLVSILKNHVVAGRIHSGEAVAAGSAKTLQGEAVRIKVRDRVAKVNDSKLVATDIDASNGVIHVIDAVLIPSGNDRAATDPRHMIEQAIVEGAPLYNAGHADACAKVYMSTVENILAMDDHSMPHATTVAMQVALKKAQHTSCSNTMAWTLRHAMDLAYHSINPVR